MSTIAARGIVPEPIARQPWEMLIPLLLITGFGGLVLYSAGGGSMQPFAMSHFIRFLVFSVMAAIIASTARPASALDSSAASATAPMNSALFIIDSLSELNPRV